MPEKKSESEANFTQFINGFVIQTLVHLGKMPNPMTGQANVDLANAKYSIDILGVLQEKTKGNLTPEESEYLSNRLRDLRMEFVSTSQRGGSCGCGCGDKGEKSGDTCGCDSGGKGEKNGDTCGCDSGGKECGGGNNGGGCGCNN